MGRRFVAWVVSAASVAAWGAVTWEPARKLRRPEAARPTGGESEGFSRAAQTDWLPHIRRSLHDPLVQRALREAPPAPPLPPPYPGDDPAMEAARTIRSRVPSFYNYRATVPGGEWRVSSAHRWRIRPAERCLDALADAGVRATPYPSKNEDLEESASEIIDTFPTPTPVTVRHPIHGVSFISAQGPLLVSCELASRLPAVARVLRPHGVTRVVVSSSQRERPRTSFHTFGMALDIPRMKVEEPLEGIDGARSRWLVVERDLPPEPNLPTCHASRLRNDGALAKNARGRRLVAIACALFDTGVLSSVLTPNYNWGHHDHLHIDVRPDDPRAFLR